MNEVRDRIEPSAVGRMSRRALVAATWLVPALVLAVSGGAKLLDPSGVAPQVASGLTARISYPVLLRLLGAIELAAAISLLMPRTRRAGRVVAFLLFFAFSAFVALHADDARFISACGCFGPLSMGVSSAAATRVAWMLARNALLGAIVAFGVYADRPRGDGLRVGAGNAMFIGVIVLLGTMYVAERTLRERGRRDLYAVEVGSTRGQSLGWRLPDVALLRGDGGATSAREAFRSGDHLLFFTTSCPICKRVATGWGELARRIEATGGRLVLVAAEDDDGTVAEFKATRGLGSLTHVVLKDRADMRPLGVAGVPQLIALGPNLEVTFNESQSRAPTFAESLEADSRRIEGLDRAVWDRFAVALFGAGAACDAVPHPSAGSLPVDVRNVGNVVGRLAIVHGGERPSYDVELAVGLDSGGTIRGILPVSRGAYLQLLDPDFRTLDVLRGLSLDDAIQKSAEVARAGGPEGTVAWGVGRALQKLSLALAKR